MGRPDPFCVVAFGQWSVGWLVQLLRLAMGLSGSFTESERWAVFLMQGIDAFRGGGAYRLSRRMLSRMCVDHEPANERRALLTGLEGT